MIVNNSPGIIIVASMNANIESLPTNSSLANANADNTVITNDNKVETKPTLDERLSKMESVFEKIKERLDLGI